MASSNRPSEFTVRVPIRDPAKNYSVLKFNESLGLDVANWAVAGTTVRMEREDNRQVQVNASASKQEYGAGSEFGKAAREEARRKKYGRQLRGYAHDEQPWKLAVEANDGKVRRFRSIRDAGAGDHADYWVFLKAGDGLFDAFKVNDWYQFLPEITHRTLDIDQAEEQFAERSKVMNQFALKAQIQAKLIKDEDEEKLDTKAKNLKIRDKDEESDDDDDLSDSDKVKDEDDSFVGKKKNAKNSKKKPRKNKKPHVDNADEVAAYESDDGDDEGREYDYMSDSGSESDRDNIPIEDKVEKALVGVSDETGLKKMMDSDDEESSDDDETGVKLSNTADASAAGKTDAKAEQDDEEKDSSGSDSDDPDKEKIDSVVFLPRATSSEDVKKETGSNAKMETSAQGKKRPGGGEDATDGPSESKRIKTESGAPSGSTTTPSSSSLITPSSTSEGLTEEAVRKYLRRKPHTTKELLGKFKPRCQGMSKTDIVTQLAAILKRVQPHQFKQKQGKKEVLFFSLKP